MLFYHYCCVDADDFGNGPFQLIFGSGDSIRCAPVPIRSDNIIEGDETFSIFVTDASPMVDFTVDTQEIIIIDSTGTCPMDCITVL